MLASFRKIAFKLALLAGVPVLGVLLLSGEIAFSARERARAADAIGSIEDLAELSARMADAIDELQTERALAALALGLRDAGTPDERMQQSVKAELIAQEQKTDRATGAVNAFLDKRNRKGLPSRLRQDLEKAQIAFADARKQGFQVASGNWSVGSVLDLYGQTDDALIDATAALRGLSTDGEMLQGLSSLVEIMQVQESESRVHAVLSHTFARGEFAPGLFRYLVTLVTEEGVHAASLLSFSTAAQAQSYHRVAQSAVSLRAGQMLDRALEATEDNFGINANDWFLAQEAKVHALTGLEEEHAEHVREVARNKLDETRRALRYSEALMITVVLASVFLAVATGRGITRSVLSLAKVAGRVLREKDFSLRAVGQTRDELGTLTDAFNEMLTGIQDRDRELSSHRANLESLVDERTIALSKRNEEMRLVLDTVEQGLVRLDKDGRMSPERSRAFDTFFGSPSPDEPYFKRIAQGDRALETALELDWAQLREGFLPLEVVLAQATDHIQIGGNHFALGYKPILEDAEMTGALLTVSDVTGEVMAHRNESIQREQLKIFARIMKDRAGYLEFFREVRGLLERIREDNFASDAEKSRVIHTLKGNAALFDVTSVAEAAHELEQILSEPAPRGEEAARNNLLLAWEEFARSALSLLGEDQGERYELSRAELVEMTRIVRDRRDPDLERMLEYIQGEPLRRRFERVADQLRTAGRRLGRSETEVTFSGGELRLPSALLSPFWTAFAHVVRNIADHGLESVEERQQAGKPIQNQVSLSACFSSEALVIEVRDDGKGIDWARVAGTARTRGLAHATRAQLVDAVFAPGLSTKEIVSETSGRGVGMAAVREACRGFGGDCSIESEPGKGAKFTFTLPLARGGAPFSAQGARLAG